MHLLNYLQCGGVLMIEAYLKKTFYVNCFFAANSTQRKKSTWIRPQNYYESAKQLY